MRIGVGASIVGPLTIGDDVRIASLALVISDILAGVTAFGNPARPIPAREKSPIVVSTQ